MASRVEEVQQHLLTHSTILIASGFLAGVLFTQNVPLLQASPTIFTVLFGLVAYFGLGYLAQTRRYKALQAAQEAEQAELENRVDRHVPAAEENRPVHVRSDYHPRTMGVNGGKPRQYEQI